LTFNRFLINFDGFRLSRSSRCGFVAEFRINISNLSEGIHEYLFEAEPFKIGLDEQFSDKVKIKVKLDKSARQILIHTNIWSEGVFVCDRCLANFKKPVNGMYSMVYIQSDRSTIDLKKEDEVQVLSADTNYIDLDEDVRQYIFLAIPQKLLCQEECKGICPECGVNRNIESCTCDIHTTDSRWDALKKLSHN
jgi:uncharacterized protein